MNEPTKVVSRICRTCEVEKPAAAFGVEFRSGRMVTRYHCKPCHNKRKNDARRERMKAASDVRQRQEQLAPAGLRLCTRCKEEKPIERFGSAVPGATQNVCAVCRGKIRRATAKLADEVKPDSRTHCECGERKELCAESCARCAMLDGESGQRGVVISAMRVLGDRWSTSIDIAAEAGVSQRQVLRALAELVPAGRVRRILVEDETGREAAQFRLREPGAANDNHRLTVANDNADFDADDDSEESAA